MSHRFVRPTPGPPSPTRFPPIARTTLDNGLRVWHIAHDGVPIVSVSLLVPRGSGDDPAALHGLASLTGDLLDEGAGSRDAIAVAEAFARLGSQLDVDVGPDVTTMSFSGLSRVLVPGLGLLADVVRCPRLANDDFERVRDLRVSRLRQLSRSASTMADRAYVSAVFGEHAYGHGAMGTTVALSEMAVDDARSFWAEMFGPAGATLIVTGDVESLAVARAAEEAFGTWEATGAESSPRTARPDAAADRRVLVVDRPGAPQSELRIGHVGPPRTTERYHALVVLNAVLGGQFTSRINRRLREEKGITYGAHTAFDFRKLAGTFACDTSVEADATASAVADVLDEFDRVRRAAVGEAELGAARASLTRGYVRNFETAGQLGRAAGQLATHALPDSTFDRFVPLVEAVRAEAVFEAAKADVRPDDATVVVVGDAARVVPSLQALGRPVVATKPEF